MWALAGPGLLAASWVINPALGFFFAFVLPAWAIVGVALAGVGVGRRELPVWAGLVPVLALGACGPALEAHRDWYMRRADVALRDVMTAVASDQPDPHLEPGRLMIEVPPAERRQLAAEFIGGQCRPIHRDEWWGSQEISLQCSARRELRVDLTERYPGRWSVVARVVTPPQQ